MTDEVAEDVARLDLDQQSESASSTFVSDMTSFSDEISDTWIATYCSLMGHEFFAEVSEDFIEDDFNLTGLQAQVPLFKEALEMILDVEPDEEEDEEEEEEEEEDDGILGDEKPPGYRRPERKHARVASDLSVIESSAELLYGLIHQRYITSRPGIQQMVEKYELQHFGVCPRVFCNGCRVLPVGRSDTPGVDTVKLFCPSCQDIYTPPNSRFQAIDGAFFGTTFGSLFFMTFPEFDVGLSRDSALPSANPSSPPGAAPAQEPVAPPNQPETINGVLTSNLAPGLGHGKIYEQRIYGFRVSERARTGPRMRWLRMKPADITELDEYSIFHVRATERDEEDDGDGDVEMPSPEPESQQAAIEQRKKAPLRKPRLGQKNSAGDG